MEKIEKDHPVKFKQNLQILRKRAGFSQEELAEKMDVSRQSVSKWESGEAYPEMKMLLALCDLFHVNLDDLVHGDVEIKEDTPLRQKYEKLTRRRATLVPIGIGLILIGVTILLALQGIFKTQAPDPLSAITSQGFIDLEHADFEPLTVAPLLVLVAIAVVLFIIAGNEEDDFKRRYRSLPNLYTADELETLMPKTRYFIATGIVMLIATTIYLITGFAFGLWKTTWWVFPIGGILCGITAIIIKSTRK